ncbi:MAG: secondary thiamine-phosphate synthase enzyme YjbQ [Hoylesella enoeca]|uniref:secondary thiamine-phosphate synthase enzyme YjbQ n=1 Tax=Hoylesella enoeca TaxID=76123 RepID=UPI00288B08BD|nr:secondary thiamine-phosphate synthase enzyme YjbQ [Hoylesella enoeca]
MVFQTEITLDPHPRGFHLITGDIMRRLPTLPQTGVLNLFVKHTSCALSLNENADPAVRSDLETAFDRLIPDNTKGFQHTLEGRDDMPAHVKSVITGVSLSIPITRGRLNLGIWQGIYLCEFRQNGEERILIATIIGE